MPQGAQQTSGRMNVYSASTGIPMQRISTFAAVDLERVNRIILSEMQSPVSLIPQLAGHLIQAGGKRIRPLVTILAGRLFPGADMDRICHLAACVEFIHAATLLHDDVVDESLLRRGIPTANTIWGNKSTVLVGDFLFSRAFQLMVRDGSLDVLEQLSNAAARISEGEVLQQMTMGNLESGESLYLEVATAKTAPLFESAACVGAIVAGRPLEERSALSEYGRLLGITFQLVDDILDYRPFGNKTGKNAGDDFREGKITLPVIIAWDKGSAAERSFWKRTMTDLSQKEDDLDQAMVLLESHNAFEMAFSKAEQMAHKAMETLHLFPECDAKTCLMNLVVQALNRS